MAYKNIELRRQRGRERYARNREAWKQAAHEYYMRNIDVLREKARVRARENYDKYEDTRKAYYEANKDKRQTQSRLYYQENKEKMKDYAVAYRKENHERLQNMRAQANVELHNARKMCPAFRFVDKIRLANIELYKTKYRPCSNLAHKAAKQCAAIVAGDYTLCPICNDCTMSEKQMRCVCPMPSVFEFDGAVSAIRAHAADIVMTNQK